MKTLGIILIVAGIVMLIYSGFTFKTKEKVLDVGPLEVNKEKTHHVNWAPIGGVVILVAGVAVVLTAKKN